MENVLIKIEERDGRRAVNARELHQALGSKRQFADWIKERISKYGFVENQDYEVFHNSVKRETGGATRIDYALSLDMAKELAMVENNEEGRKIRQYFIECEKKAHGEMLALPQNFSDALRMLADKVEQNTKQQHLIEVQNTQIHELTNSVAEMQEKVSYVDRILASKSTVTVTQIAQDYGMSAKKMNKILEKLRVQRRVNDQWILYGNYVKDGLVHSKPFPIEKPDGRVEVKYNTEWTQKGRLRLYEELKKHGITPLIEQPVLI